MAWGEDPRVKLVAHLIELGTPFQPTYEESFSTLDISYFDKLFCKKHKRNMVSIILKLTWDAQDKRQNTQPRCRKGLPS